MSVSAETYIVIALMFAVFSAVAAVGTSVVLGAGFERLRLGFEIVKKQTGFFSDAIYKLDQRTQKLDEETAKLKAGVYGMNDRMERVEKQTTFIADAVNSIESRILQGSPIQPSPVQPDEQSRIKTDGMHPVHVVGRHGPANKQPEISMAGMFGDYPMDVRPVPQSHSDMAEEELAEDHDSAGGLGSLLSRYFLGENDKGVIYH